METSSPRPVELLAPARDADTALAALAAGADAVYMGGPMLGARQDAPNAVADIRRVVSQAHRWGARLYVTLNTIIYDDELPAAEALIWELYRAGVDALIVQDMALLRMKLPPIELHASTQCDTRTPQKALFLAQAGFSQVVVARECTIDEITEIAAALKPLGTKVEAFVHGALCVCFSGDCRASLALTGRSANRGACAQICRLPFDLVDDQGRKIIAGRHLLSLRDLNRAQSLPQLLQAGVSSLKIEGRLKDANYVKNVMAFYRRELDKIIDANPSLYSHASAGRTVINFIPDVTKSFNRGFTDYFFYPHPTANSFANFRSPKFTGEPVATVKEIGSTPSGLPKWRVEATAALHNGDGLGFYTPDGGFTGFRLNRVEGSWLFPAEKISLTPGTILLRNSDKAFTDALASPDAVTRKMPITMVLRLTPSRNAIALTLTDATGVSITVAEPYLYQTAKTPQEISRRRVLEKLGDTMFVITSGPDAISDRVGDAFIPASCLASLRRRACEMLEQARLARYRFHYRREASTDLALPSDMLQLTYRDNVANRLARQFYTDLGALVRQPAAEVQTPSSPQLLMECRYCLRRQLGQCLKHKNSTSTPSGTSSATFPKLPSGPLYLVSGTKRMRLKFDCARCRMQLWTP